MTENDTPQQDDRKIIDIAARRGEKDRAAQSSHPPFLNLPPVTKAMLIGLVLIHAVISLFLSRPDQAALYLTFGFTPAAWTGGFGFTPLSLVTPVTYMALHGGWMHLIMNATMLMAFGAGLERWIGKTRFIVFFILCGLCGVLAETVVHPFLDHPVIGASGALSGLFAAVLIGLQKSGRLPTGRFGIWPFAALWIGISAVFGLFSGDLAGGPIAWAAHLGGFLGGVALTKLRYFRL